MKISKTLRNIITAAFEDKIKEATRKITTEAAEQSKIIRQQLSEMPEAQAAYDAFKELRVKYDELTKDEEMSCGNPTDINTKSVDFFVNVFRFGILTRKKTDEATEKIRHERDLLLIKLEYESDLDSVKATMLTYGIVL